MRDFQCHCGNRIFFENTRCLACGRTLGFVPDRLRLLALEPCTDGLWRPAGGGGGRFRSCANAEQAGCNWLLPETDAGPRCRSCRLNQVIPDLGRPLNRLYWRRIEAAKRRLIYSLLRLGLPIVDRAADPESGLSFAFLADAPEPGEFSDAFDSTPARVLTGHHNGLITINVAEADDVERERMRTLMNEHYRTLLGHFRHEIAHYYWPRLLPEGPRREAFRALFGDERADYGQALERYYRDGPPPDWQQRYVSAYAASHPWEDWAESFAHYLHMIDTLEAAADAGILPGRAGQRRLPEDIGTLITLWRELVVVLNALNRCMGQPDAYPFVLTGVADDKLGFVHETIAAAAAPR